MDYREKIISDMAEIECRKISGRVIRDLQKMTEGMQSGFDSALKNVWDEICVQVQGDESVMWGAYLDTTRSVIERKVEQLDAKTKQAIWLQTDEGMDWATENEGQDTVTFSEDDITEYVLNDFVISAAANWANRRIEKYLESEHD